MSEVGHQRTKLAIGKTPSPTLGLSLSSAKWEDWVSVSSEDHSSSPLNLWGSHEMLGCQIIQDFWSIEVEGFSEEGGNCI